MVSTWRYYCLDIKKLFRFPTFRFSVVLLLVIIGIADLLATVNADQSMFSWIDTFIGSFSAALFFGTLGMIVTAAHFVSSEYNNRTVQIAIATGTSRATFILGKSLSLVTGTYFLVSIAVLFSLLLAAFSGILMGPFTIQNLSLLHFLLTLLLSPLKILPIMFLTFFLAIATRSSILPIAFMLFYTTPGELILASLVLPSPYKDLLPGQIAKPIDAITTFKMNLLLNTAGQERIARVTADFIFSYWVSISAVLAFVIAMGLLSYVVSRSQDLSR